MTEGNKARIQKLVQELDDLVPRTNAVVLMTQYGGGCDESQITATETGYLRMGIELLKATVAPPLDGDDNGVQIGVDWEYLISEKSGVCFHMFHLDNSLRPDVPYIPQARLAWKERLSLTAGILLTGLLVWVFGVGVVTVAKWVLR